MQTSLVSKAALAVALLAAAGSAGAASFSFDGSFGQDKDLQYFKFTADGTSTVTIHSYGYAGGTQADGAVVQEGGFDPLLTLYSATTGAMAAAGDFSFGYLNDDGATGTVNTDSVTGLALDSYYEGVLAAGDYWLVLSVSNNYGDNTVFGPFGWDGWTGNQTSANFGCSPETNTPFYEYDCAVRDGHLALDLLGVSQAEETSKPTGVVPELDAMAGTGALTLLGVALALSGERRRKALAA